MVTKPTADTPTHLTNARPQDIRPTGRMSGGAGGDLALGKLNERQEKFAHFVAMGKTQAEASGLAGYSPHAASGSRLAGIPAIKARISELREQYQSQAVIRIETAKAEIERLIEEEKLNLAYFIKEFRANLELARQDGAIRDANDCLKCMAQMLGFMKAKDLEPPDGKKNDQPRTQIGIQIQNNNPHAVGGPPRILIEDPDAVVDVAASEPIEDVP